MRRRDDDRPTDLHFPKQADQVLDLESVQTDAGHPDQWSGYPYKRRG